jgi:hypothetical protein
MNAENYNKILIIINIILLLIIIYNFNSKKEGFETTNQTTAEAIANVASLYNTGNFKVTNLEVTSDLTGGKNYLPIGSIIAWYNKDGDVTKIPKGWSLCNGENGTPDLRGRFIRMFSNTVPNSAEADKAWGVGAGERWFYDNNNAPNYYSTLIGASRIEPRAMIGKFKMNEKGGTDLHNLDIKEMPSHTHTVQLYHSGDGYNGGGPPTPLVTDTSRPDYTRTSSIAGNSEHHNNMPPFYTLAYIMRIA